MNYSESIDEIIANFFIARDVQYHDDFVRSQSRANRRARDQTFTRIPFVMRARVSQRTSKEPLLKSR